MRSALTTLGIIIGVGAVIAMVEIGQGSKSAIQQTIASMGANSLLVQSGAATSGGVSFGSGSVLTLTPQDSDEIARQCPAVEAVAPIVRARAQVIYGNHNWVPMNIYGTTPHYLVVRDWEQMDEGDMFTDSDVTSGATRLRDWPNAWCASCLKDIRRWGKTFACRTFRCASSACSAAKGANTFGMDQDDIVIAPWTTIKYPRDGQQRAKCESKRRDCGTRSIRLSTAVNTLTNLYPGASSAVCRSVDRSQAGRHAADRCGSPTSIRLWSKAARRGRDSRSHRSNHRLASTNAIGFGLTNEDDFNIRDMTEITKAMTSTSDLMSMLLLVVAFISLFVGGVGIMNIMLVSVTERTREIGLRMAVGARSYHILRQFLIEAVVLCLLGGTMGILLGRGASFLVRMTMHWPTQISVPAIIAAFVVSVTVGVVFGFYPAWKASRLDPIEALRYE